MFNMSVVMVALVLCNSHTAIFLHIYRAFNRNDFQQSINQEIWQLIID